MREDGGIWVVMARTLSPCDARRLASGLLMSAHAAEGKPYPTDGGMDVIPVEEINATLRRFCEEIDDP